MYDVGLRDDELEEYIATLSGQRPSYSVRWRVQVLNLEHDPLDDLTPNVIDAQVSISLDGEHASRSADVALFDPNDDLSFLESADGSKGIWFLRLMIQIHVDVWVERLNRWVECPVFTGPIIDFKRSNGVVTLGCAGKEYLARKSWPRITIKKGTETTDAIRQVLESFGESEFRFARNPGNRLTADRVMERSGTLSPWGWCRQAAGRVGMRLFYDGAGTCVLRHRKDDEPVAFFVDGNGGNVISVPETTSDYSNLLNVARVEGQSSGSGKAPGGEATVEASSPIHPSKLRRNGKSLYLGEVIQSETVKTNAQGVTAAKDTLRDRQYLSSSTSFDALPLFPVEEYDPFRVRTMKLTSVRILSRCTFSYDPTELMSVGYNRKISPTLASLRSL